MGTIVRIACGRHLSLLTKISVLGLRGSFSNRFTTASVVEPKIRAALATNKYVVSADVPFASLDCASAFSSLSDRERRYAHHLSRACWAGSLIVLLQTSPESPYLYVLLYSVFARQSFDELRNMAVNECSFTPQDWEGFLAYVSSVFAHMGNYRSFGDTKLIPAVCEHKLRRFLYRTQAVCGGSCTHSTCLNHHRMRHLVDVCVPAMCSLSAASSQLGFHDAQGVTTYLSSNCTATDAQLVSNYLQNSQLEAYNTRVFKTFHDGDSTPRYEVRLASFLTTPQPGLTRTPELFDGAYFSVTRGDYSSLLHLVIKHLTSSLDYTSNVNEREMIRNYIDSFRSGCLNAHKNGSRAWIRNQAPSVETYIGFIETYRDPSGMRGEFEGFVAMVNRNMSAKFARLVNASAHLLDKLPWPKEFEMDRFLRPDFTSLDVLTFAGSGVPSGINIPNYSELRQREGFKNVSLGNVIRCRPPTLEWPFLSADDARLLEKYRVDAFEITVGLHELFGHGSGKLFTTEHTDGALCSKLRDVTLTHYNRLRLTPPQPGYYLRAQTFDSVFGDIGSAYEECRAECVALYLCCEPQVLRIFDIEAAHAEHIVHAIWLDMVYKGFVTALEMYSLEADKFMQAHSHARFVILRLLLEHGDGVVHLESLPAAAADDLIDFRLSVDRKRILTSGRTAIGQFLEQVQILRSTADVGAARHLLAKYSSLDDLLPHGSLTFRQCVPHVLRRRRPRSLLVQPNTAIQDDGTVRLTNYEPSSRGLIQSTIDRFKEYDVTVSETNINESLIRLADNDSAHFQCINVT